MTNGISEPISQGKHRKDAEENGRMEEVVDLLLRSSCKDEGELCSWSAYRRSLYEEQEFVEDYIKSANCWISLNEVFALGVPGPSGSENDTFVDRNGHIVYKMNNLIHAGSYFKLFHRLLLHNELFPQTAYTLVGFTGFRGRTIYPLFAQGYVENATASQPEEIQRHMHSLGFTKTKEWTYENDRFIISDLKPKNVLKDADGDFYIIDAEIAIRE